MTVDGTHAKIECEEKSDPFSQDHLGDSGGADF